MTGKVIKGVNMCYTKHKCASIDCNNIISQEEVWCLECLDKLSDFIETYPLASGIKE